VISTFKRNTVTFVLFSFTPSGFKLDMRGIAGNDGGPARAADIWKSFLLSKENFTFIHGEKKIIIWKYSFLGKNEIETCHACMGMTAVPGEQCIACVYSVNKRMKTNVTEQRLLRLLAVIKILRHSNCLQISASAS
jgi:hypothetical protein